jgi:hypothetical protein
MKNLIQVYSERKTPRLIYALNLVLRNIMGADYLFTNTPDPDLPLINYSDNKSVGGVFILPEPLLFETGVRPQDVWIAHIDKLPLFFQQPPEAVFPLDIFAFAFFHASRYEEYLHFYPDEHGRFAAELSMAYRHNFLNIPIVDIWTLKLAHTLGILYPGLNLKKRKFTSQLTVDIDQPFAYRSKGLLRNAGGLVLDILKKRDPWLRLRCAGRATRDPYDTFDYIVEKARAAGINITWFVSAGTRSKFDLNPNPRSGCYRRLIKKLVTFGTVGLHPSWLSSQEVMRNATEEKNRAEEKNTTEDRNGAVAKNTTEERNRAEERNGAVASNTTEEKNRAEERNTTEERNSVGERLTVEEKNTTDKKKKPYAESRVAAEKLVVEEVAGVTISSSRQHYLVLRFPETYRTLSGRGITTDHTMGFLREPGFRAGIARPYHFYDLEAEQETDLLIVPFQYMDGTFQQYKKLIPEEAIKEIKKLADITREVGGHFVSVWHNTSLTENDGWEGWRKVFEDSLIIQKP